MDARARVSYPRPAESVHPPAPFPIPTSLLPLSAPPAHCAPPYIPDSRGGCHGEWTRSTHVFPAAYLRKPTLRAPPGKPAADEINRRREQHYNGRWERLDSRGEVLWTVAERFVRRNHDAGAVRACGRPVTLVCTHANGMHKETFDEMLRNLLATGLPGEEVINEVWTLDAVTQGEGGRINEPELPDVFDWTDNARDVLNFLLAYLPNATDSTSPSLPSILPRASDREIASRREQGFAERKLVALGHSQGGASIAIAATELPALFDSIILVDPVIVSPIHRGVNYSVMTAVTTKRRDVWPSRDEAATLLLKSPFFQLWHPAVFQSYLDYGMYTDASGDARLKCTPYQEASSFSELRAPAYAWYRLPRLPATVELFWILAGTENNPTGGDVGTPHTVWRRPENSSNVRVEGAGHLIVQHKPVKLAGLVSEFLARKYAPGPKAKM